MDKSEKMKELFLNASFKEQVKDVSNVDELREAFSKNGLELSVEEVIDLCERIVNQVNKSSDCEISEEALSDVTGGIAWALVGLGAACIGAAALGIYNGYQETKRSDSKNKSK